MKKTKGNLFSVFLWLLLALPLTACSPLNTTLPASQPTAAQSNGSYYPLRIANYDTNEKEIFYIYKKTPERVIITHPGATELMLELGLEEHILSTVAPYGATLDRLAGKYAKLNILKAQYDPSQEELVEMQPDMLIGWAHQFTSHGIGEVKTWQHRDVGTFILQSTLTKTKPTLENTVYASIADLGSIFNIQKKADEYIGQAKIRVASVEKAVKDIKQKKTVLVLQDHLNGTFSLYDNHYLISHMITLAGGISLCQDPASFVGAEKVLGFDPDYILVVSTSREDGAKDMTDKEAIDSLQKIKELQSMRAIRTGSIINLPFFTVNNGGVRTIDAIEKIAKSLYPDHFH
jgi:iron complex transport system substrate-binding protein